MNARAEIERDLRNFVTKALSLSVISNPRIGGHFYDDSCRITSGYTFFRDEDDYLLRYAEAYENGRFLCAMHDGSFFQVKYDFTVPAKGRSYIEKVNLSFLPAVREGRLQYHHIRLDYDETIENSFFHPPAHMHVGFLENFRVPIDSILLFSEFFLLISHWFYPEIFSKLSTISTDKMSLINQSGGLTKVLPLPRELADQCYIKSATGNNLFRR